MRLSLTLKLTAAFVGVGLVAVILVAIFAQTTTVQEYNRLRIDQIRSNFISAAEEYYLEHDSWIGVFDTLRQAPPKPGGAEPMLFVLVDQNGKIIVPGGPFRMGDQAPANLVEKGTDINLNGEVVGTVLPIDAPPPREPAEETYLSNINQALIRTGLISIAIALLLGTLLARTITRPMRELTRATRAMAQGELEQCVSIRSQDEMGELASSFNQMSADLARANRLRREMTADIAHDLRSPLAVIRGYAEALRDGDLPPTQETFQVIYQEVEQLNRLVDDLRTLSLADAGELALNRVAVQPRYLLERAASAHTPRANQSGIKLQVEEEENVSQVLVDPERIAQVLDNLVTNAIRYTGGKGCITLSAGQHDHSVYLSVQDTGPGITPEDIPRVFDRFYRGDSARQTDEGESGLGLAIAKSLVELHGGTISVQSNPGEGTTFTILLPSIPSELDP
ncbi:MAG: HAMP domain-containing protein [Anaerolineales bacterium]|nr:HAMP domain-containing protein [Anaerolineales bacterium]